MYLPLSQAPYDIPLVYAHVTEPQLAQRLKHLGIAKGDIITRMSEDAVICPVRVRTPKGEVVLASGMAMKIIAHHDDGHKTPVAEMQPGEEGHVEGVVCGTALEQGLGILGIRENDRITMLHRVPPMDYLAIKQGVRVCLTEGAAAKIWGMSQGREMQFAVARRNVPFTIITLLGGMRATAMLERRGFSPGVELLLESVRPASSSGYYAQNQTVLATHSGLRLYLRRDQEQNVMVGMK